MIILDIHFFVFVIEWVASDLPLNNILACAKHACHCSLEIYEQAQVDENSSYATALGHHIVIVYLVIIFQVLPVYHQLWREFKPID